MCRAGAQRIRMMCNTQRCVNGAKCHIQLSSFLHQRLSSVAQEMLVQVERALTLALDQEKPLSSDLQTPVPAPEVSRTFKDGNQPMTRPAHEAPYNLKQEFLCDSIVDQSNKAQDCDAKEADDPIQELKGFIEPIYDDEDEDEEDVNIPTVTVELETGFESYTDDSNEPSWVRHGAKPLIKQKTESEQPVIAQEIKATQSEEKPFSCDVCGKGFKHKRNVIVHKRIHTGERPYQCDFCSKSFTQNSDLKTHTRTHTGERPYTCEFCNKSFTQSSSLKTHKRTHTGERPYHCDVCNESFMSGGHLMMHKRTHTGERPHQCDVCSKSFIKSGSLKRHKCTHTEERPYTCDICGKAFSQSQYLKLHMCKCVKNPEVPHCEATAESLTLSSYVKTEED